MTGYHIGDNLALLKRVPDESVQCCITSPPYWALRDYGVEGQIGLEETPQEYIEKLVEVFDQVHRVLRKDGTLWLNMGDKSARSGRGGIGRASTLSGSHRGQNESRKPKTTRVAAGFKPKDILGLPWRLAFALQDAGWYLRSDIIWHKPNVQPESVRDRPTRAHEYVFLLSKSQKYFYDFEAVKEPVTGNAHPRGNGVNKKAKRNHGSIKQNASFSAAVKGLVETRNRRSVWSIHTEAVPEAHFATFPRALVAVCMMAGTRPGDLVLDPFGGSGTVACVADTLDRQWLLLDLNPEYANIARQRIMKNAFRQA